MMTTRPWEIAAAAGLLAICLVMGLFLAEILAPKPVVGTIRFASEIDFESTEQLVKLLEAARQDDRVAAVVLEVLSPGGYATSSESLFYALLQLRQAKPVVIVIDGLAASGGYYMAAAGNRIFAPASSYVGNVGTRGGRPSDPSITADEMSSGPYKLEGGSRFDQIHQLELVAGAFVNNVVNQRNQSTENPLKLSPEEVAEARIYLGSEALALGLIDAEGGRSEGIQAAVELAGLSDYDVVDLSEFLDMAAVPPPQDLGQSLKEMFQTAPPGTIFMLDSRIPMPAPALPTALQRLPAKSGRNDAVLSSAAGGVSVDNLPSWIPGPPLEARP